MSQLCEVSEVSMVGDGTYLTLGEAAEILAPFVSEATVRRMVDRGELRAVRIGPRRDRRVLAEDVRAHRAALEAEVLGGEGPGVPAG